MAIGNQATSSTVNQTLGDNAIALRNMLRGISNFAEWVNSLGLSGLEALGFSASDAQAVLNMVSYQNTIAGVYFGTVTQGSLFNFDNALSQLWGGQ